MPKFWKFKAWLHNWFSKLLALVIIAALAYGIWLVIPGILSAFGFLDSEMGM